jgi:parallel beta-helix repeat protein
MCIGRGFSTLSAVLLGVTLSACGGGGSSTPSQPPPPEPLFVRASVGKDTNSGDRDHPLKTIGKAAQLALSGYHIYVGAGTYAEGVTTATQGAAPQALSFIADQTGAFTGEQAGDVIVDATNASSNAGFKLSNSSGTLIEGFTVMGASDGGIVIKTSSNFTVQHCIVHDNSGDGIRIQDSPNAVIFDNLVYRNGDFRNHKNGLGVGLVGQSSGSADAMVISNTFFGNCDRGVTIGNSSVASPGAFVHNNIVQNNGLCPSPSDPTNTPLENIKVFVNPRSDQGYDGDFNLVFPATYLPASTRGAHDVTDSGAGFVSTDFHLSAVSPAIDRGGELPSNFVSVLMVRAAQVNTTTDPLPLDLGFHYPP